MGINTKVSTARTASAHSGLIARDGMGASGPVDQALAWAGWVERTQLAQFAARLLEVQPLEQLVGDGQVIGTEVGPVVEDRHGALGGFGVGDRRADRRLHELVAEVLAQRVKRLA